MVREGVGRGALGQCGPTLGTSKGNHLGQGSQIHKCFLARGHGGMSSHTAPDDSLQPKERWAV